MSRYITLVNANVFFLCTPVCMFEILCKMLFLHEMSPMQWCLDPCHSYMENRFIWSSKKLISTWACTIFENAISEVKHLHLLLINEKYSKKNKIITESVKLFSLKLKLYNFISNLRIWILKVKNLNVKYVFTLTNDKMKAYKPFGRGHFAFFLGVGPGVLLLSVFNYSSVSEKLK